MIIERKFSLFDLVMGISTAVSTHSAGVAASARKLAGLLGFSEAECRIMEIAGLLHDLGKLVVPAEILEKAGRLDPQERSVIQSHTFYAHDILRTVEGLEVVALWASLHHERLDGTGYPFHLAADEIPLGSRVMAVADVFTALREERPYRGSMDRKEVVQVLRSMATEGALDPLVVSVLAERLPDIDRARQAAQKARVAEFKALAA